jgi:hypothetical protein
LNEKEQAYYITYSVYKIIKGEGKEREIGEEKRQKKR